MAPFSFLLLILILVIGAAFGLSSRRIKLARADHHHWLVRAFCALLATAALVAVGIGTWQGAAINPAPEPVLVSQPTTAPPPLPKTPEDRGEIDLGPCKLIATVLVAREVQDRFIPLAGGSQTLDWPPTADSRLVIACEYDDASYTVTMDLARFSRWNQDDKVHTRQGISVETKGRSWSSSSGGGTLELDRLHVEDFGNGGRFHRAGLSALTSPVSPDLFLLIHLTRAESADPLRQIPAGQWLDAVPNSHRRDRSNRHHSGNGRSSSSNEPPGVRMLAFMGLSVIFLLLAAIAGSAVFRRGRRELGFTALLTGMVLYAGLLEFIVLRHNTRLATDAAQPDIVRASALDGMRFSTFFHTGTAEARIRQIAKDPATTPTIRSLAEALRDEDN